MDVHPAVMIALQADAAVAVHDMAGDEVTLYNSMPSMPGMSEMPAMAHDEGRAVTAEVVVDGQRAGVAEVTFREQ